MSDAPDHRTDEERKLQRIRQTLDDLERMLKRLPERPRTPVCVDLVLRLRLEVNKMLGDSDLSGGSSPRRS